MQCFQIIFLWHILELGKPLQEEEAPLILLNPGQTLSLGCKVKINPPAKWYFNNTKVLWICIEWVSIDVFLFLTYDFSHFSHLQLSGGTATFYHETTEYFCHDSVSVHDSGEYICKCGDNRTKAVKVLVHGRWKHILWPDTGLYVLWHVQQ